MSFGSKGQEAELRQTAIYCQNVFLISKHGVWVEKKATLHMHNRIISSLFTHLLTSLEFQGCWSFGIGFEGSEYTIHGEY